ncbi:helix-turn-helix domain-containing protein [Patescibacteria group bacterium]
MSKIIYSKDHQYIVERLKKARKESGLEQTEVAKLIGRTQSHVSKVEAGQRRIDVVALKEFARIYKKSFDYFLKI